MSDQDRHARNILLMKKRAGKSHMSTTRRLSAPSLYVTDVFRPTTRAAAGRGAGTPSGGVRDDGGSDAAGTARGSESFATMMTVRRIPAAGCRVYGSARRVPGARRPGLGGGAETAMVPGEFADPRWRVAYRIAVRPRQWVPAGSRRLAGAEFRSRHGGAARRVRGPQARRVATHPKRDKRHIFWQTGQGFKELVGLHGYHCARPSSTPRTCKRLRYVIFSIRRVKYLDL